MGPNRNPRWSKSGLRVMLSYLGQTHEAMSLLTNDVNSRVISHFYCYRISHNVQTQCILGVIFAISGNFTNAKTDLYKKGLSYKSSD
jgi:hypothetical protein